MRLRPELWRAPEESLRTPPGTLRRRRERRTVDFRKAASTPRVVDVYVAVAVGPDQSFAAVAMRSILSPLAGAPE